MGNISKGFILAAGKRPSGSAYWLVTGTIGGKQIRREFSARADALAFVEQMNSELFGHATDQAPIITRLKPIEVRDAEAALAHLDLPPELVRFSVINPGG